MFKFRDKELGIIEYVSPNDLKVVNNILIRETRIDKEWYAVFEIDFKNRKVVVQ